MSFKVKLRVAVALSLKARLRLAIVVLVTLVVVAMSLLYLYDFTRMSFGNASSRADLVADQIETYLVDHLSQQTAIRGLHPNSVQEWKDAWTGIVRDDPDVTGMLRRSLATAEVVLAIVVTDDHGKVLAASDPTLLNKTLAPAEDLDDVHKGWWFGALWDLMMRREDYLKTRPLGFEDTKQVLFKITVVIRSVLLRHNIQPAFNNLALAFGSSLFIAIFLGSVLPNLLLDPLQRVSRSIDLIRAGQFESVGRPRGESREFADVHSKLSLLGEQYRGAKQDALELRSNIEQLLQRLEESVLLFDHTGRLRMAGEAVEHMLDKTRAELAGRPYDEIFPPSTALGGIVGNALRHREAVRDQLVTIPRDGAAPVRLLVSVEVLGRGPGQDEMGTLVTLRDLESRRQLEHQLDVSTRLAAISRLTGGVAHEIKNPLNAMALHLEVLKSKLEGQQPEVDVITREIKRLDTVVKTFLNFNKPVELKARPIDLSDLVERVLALVAIDAQAKNIEIDTALQDKLWINGDPDLLLQAILNVINNGLEAMIHGGKLSLRTMSDGDECQLSISDAGPGIAPEIQERVFNLYFTTKERGSGIGLAMTFRVVQLHSGTIDFVSDLGKGTTFRLRFPRMVDYQGAVLASSITTS
ncbi:MAG TPA: ATP-binding protein [Bryobacteraceae bacterium]|nr:ATP-binding protein [Bryobacteraceae bacterium]